MIPLVNIAAAAVTAVLTFSSGKNMLQTVALSRQNNQNQASFSIQGLKLQPEDSTETVVSKVQSMKRKDLLQLYSSSRSPKDLEEVQGEWDGCLLDNNSRVMVSYKYCTVDLGVEWRGLMNGLNF